MVAFYPSATEGHWGLGTALTDWCEHNYAVTPYVAEFWNTVSNVFFLITVLAGIHNLRTIGVSERRDFLAFGSLLVVMTGSMLFHGTMWYHAQMLDEIPMIFNGCIIVYCALRIFPESKKHDTLIWWLCTLYSLLFTPIYIYNRNPDFFVFSHAILVIGLIFLPPYQIRRLADKFKRTYDSKRIVGLWQLYWYGIVCYIGGLVIWFFENVNCLLVRQWRDAVGWPLGVLLELHMWWHFFAAFGSYAVIILLAYMRLLALGRDDVFLRWQGGYAFPYLTSTLSQAKIRSISRQKLVARMETASLLLDSD